MRLRALNPRRRKRPAKAIGPYEAMPANALAAHARFVAWAEERGLRAPQEVTRPILERYQRHLYHYRKRNGAPLSAGAQFGLLMALKAWFKWLARDNVILYNPAAELELPRQHRGLPKAILSVAQVEAILNQCDVRTALGVRNRAMLETLYSSGVRRSELIALKLYDVDIERGTLMIRRGKGAKDRLVPLGARACAWIDKYLKEVRAELLIGGDDATLFLHEDGRAFLVGRLADLVKRHMEHAGVNLPGSCHLFRHAMATHMLENGADIRFIQAMLGHEDIATTQVYTRVSIAKLKQIHAATHPARLQRRQGANGAGDGAGHQPTSEDARSALLSALDAEHDADEDRDAP